jgi:uncharacterized membrane protein
MRAIFDDPLYSLIALALAALFALGLAALVIPRVEVGSLRQLGRLFVGYRVPPALVAFARRLLTALATLLVTWLARVAGVDDGADLAAVAAGVATMVELLGWGLLDQLRKPHSNDTNPPPVAGSGGGIP